MKTISKILTIFGILFSVSNAHAGWQQTFSDEFTSLDASKWRTTDFFMRDSNIVTLEQDCYVDANASASNGMLYLSATNQTPSACSTLSTLTQQLYSGSQQTTAGSFQQRYGYFEVRAKVPKDSAMWPQIRLESPNAILGADYIQQIDLAQFYGTATSQPIQSWSYTDVNNTMGRVESIHKLAGTIDYSQDFHRYGVDWQQGLIIYYIDGVEVYRVSDANVYNGPMYMVLSLAVGGTVVGNVDASTTFPAQMQVDYVHVYQRVADGTDDTLPPAPPAPPAPSDTVAPKVAILLPINGMTVKRGSIVLLAAVATDNVKVTNTSFSINGQQVCQLNRTFDVCLWKVPTTTSVSSYSISAIAKDAAGNQGVATATLKVK